MLNLLRKGIPSRRRVLTHLVARSSSEGKSSIPLEGQIPRSGDTLDKDSYLYGDITERRDFRQSGVENEMLLKRLDELGFHTATIIQSQALKVITSGTDAVVAAETGSGKTLAYMIPVLQNCLNTLSSTLTKQHEVTRPHAVILVPNWELASQVKQLAEKLLRGTLVRTATRYENPHILICTPGAFRTHLQQLVIDEADLLLDGSYLREVSHSLSLTKDDLKIRRLASPQVILAAATIPTYGTRSFENFIKKQFPSAYHVRNPHLHHHHPQITQSFIRMKSTELLHPSRVGAIKDAIVAHEPTLVFVNTSKNAVLLAEVLRENDVQCGEFHKDCSRASREMHLNDFKEGKCSVIICTDIAARGWDLSHVRHVIQAEFALNIVQHLHRIGRCSRGGVPGKATNIHDVRSSLLIDAINCDTGNPVNVALDRSSGVDTAFSRRRGLRGKAKKESRKGRKMLRE
eukprot:GSChrysophyteH1.ASY1.ANO1.1452.1 assembled CDS